MDGYVEVPKEEYAHFSLKWIKEAERVLKPGGSLYVISGYTNLADILNALRKTALTEINHIIWKYNFGVYTKTKFVSSHYHILFHKKGGAGTPSTLSADMRATKIKERRVGKLRRSRRCLAHQSRIQTRKNQNKNELPTQLLIKIIQYSSNEGDMICDFFLGSFSTAKVAKGLNRRAGGFELSKPAFEYQLGEFSKLREGYLMDALRKAVQRRKGRLRAFRAIMAHGKEF